MTYALSDSLTMLRRNLLHVKRYPIVLFVVAIPIVLLLLFVYVFGNTLGTGLPAGGGRAAYADYIAPGILLFTIVGGAQTTAIGIAMDMTEGIVARFKTMDIWRPAVLAGHVLGSLVQTVASILGVLVVALLVGFSPEAGFVDWLGAFGLMLLLAFALTWLSVALGLVAKTVESASNLPMFLMLLPFLSSGFVPTEGMPPGLRWFAENQPFTPITETLRALLTDAPVDGSQALAALLWCAAITAGSYIWALRRYNR
jgi:ABC-2 type transport system permease protein